MFTFGILLEPLATKVKLLGLVEPGKEVLIALQSSGVEMIATDCGDNAP